MSDDSAAFWPAVFLPKYPAVAIARRDGKASTTDFRVSFTTVAMTTTNTRRSSYYGLLVRCFSPALAGFDGRPNRYAAVAALWIFPATGAVINHLMNGD